MEEEQPVKIDFVPDSKKLFIIFGGVAAGIGMPPFEFAKASNILTETRVFVRDLKQNWYQTGLPGISTNVEETKKYLDTLIEEHSPDEVIMIGNSMGGFAAIMFSSMIPNSRAVAFAPQTFICPWKRLRYMDVRWALKIFRTYLSCWQNRDFWDLNQIKPMENWKVDIFVSTQDRLDFVHAVNLSALDEVTIHKYSSGGHGLVKELRDRGELESILNGKYCT